MLPGVPIFGPVTVKWLFLIKERQRVNFRSEPGRPNSIFLGKSGMGELGTPTMKQALCWVPKGVLSVITNHHRTV